MEGYEFSASFLRWLVYGALGLTVIGTTTLLVLLAKDWKRGTLW
jgi:hypothetical protein